jgi:hypothetical protein
MEAMKSVVWTFGMTQSLEWKKWNGKKLHMPGYSPGFTLHTGSRRLCNAFQDIHMSCMSERETHPWSHALQGSLEMSYEIIRIHR